MPLDLDDAAIRKLAFQKLADLTLVNGDVLPHAPLKQGFDFQGIRVPLLGPQGIFKPRVLDLPLSITTAPNGPYDDAFADDGLLLYRYRGKDPEHRDNRGLRELMQRRLPLIYLHGITRGKYLAAWPVYIVHDNPAKLTFTVAVDEQRDFLATPGAEIPDAVAEIRRRYITQTVRARLHQRTFRTRVLEAYREQCALCRLRHVELLEAAHIIPDASEGEPRVSNGLALCTLHHAAFDRHILGVRPDDLTVEIRLDILDEIDGPMLKHGLQAMHGQRIEVPRRAELKPDPVALEARYERFRSHLYQPPRQP